MLAVLALRKADHGWLVGHNCAKTDGGGQGRRARVVRARAGGPGPAPGKPGDSGPDSALAERSWGGALAAVGAALDIAGEPPWFPPCFPDTAFSVGGKGLLRGVD